MKLSLPIILVAALAAPSFAQTQYTLNVDSAASAAQWNGSTSLGALKGNKNLNITGNIAVALDNAVAPFGGAQFNGGSSGTNPTEIYAYVDNPLPFFPPLAKIWIRDLDLELHSDHFAVASNGTWATDTWMYVVGGEVEVEALGSTTITPLAGTLTDPSPVSGTFSESGGNVDLHSPIDTTISDVMAGLTYDFTIVGDIYASAPAQPGGMDLAVTTLLAGASATFSVTNSNANDMTFVGYSLTGAGSTPIPSIGVTLDIDRPTLLFSGNSNGTGSVSWNTTVPPYPGLTVYFQACSAGVTSNVVTATVM